MVPLRKKVLKYGTPKPRQWPLHFDSHLALKHSTKPPNPKSQGGWDSLVRILHPNTLFEPLDPKSAPKTSQTNKTTSTYHDERVGKPNNVV